MTASSDNTQNGVNGTNGSSAHHTATSTNNTEELALVQPTAAERDEQTSQNGTSWRGALSIEAYLRREAHLRETGLANNAGLSYWVLVRPAAEPHGKRTVLAGCETLRKKAIVVKDGKVTEVICHGIGSVFTPPAHRGHGYGAKMMRLLGERLKSWQGEDAPVAMSVLYSDIGKVCP